MQLSSLDLSQNRITGTLPESWINFTSVSTWHRDCVYANSYCRKIAYESIHVFGCQGATVKLYSLLNVMAHIIEAAKASMQHSFDVLKLYTVVTLSPPLWRAPMRVRHSGLAGI